MLADLIIGTRVEGRPGLNFVRVPDQNRVYAARTDIGISTDFNDWIETNLLGVERDDVKRVELNEYEVDERTGSVRRRGEFIVDWVEQDVWTANDLPDGKEVDYVQMNLLVGGLMGINIVGVPPQAGGPVGQPAAGVRGADHHQRRSADDAGARVLSDAGGRDVVQRGRTEGAHRPRGALHAAFRRDSLRQR